MEHFRYRDREANILVENLDEAVDAKALDEVFS